MNTTTKPKAPTWIHAEHPNADEIRILVDRLGLEERFIRDALDRDEVPHFESIGDYTYIITRFAYKTKEGGIDTAPILFALSSAKLITVSLEKLTAPDNILPGGLQSSSHDPAEILLKILLDIDAEYDHFIHETSKRIRSMLRNIGRRNVKTETFIRFAHIEDDMNDFLSSLAPTNSVLKHLRDHKIVSSLGKKSALIDTVILNNEQSINTCENNLKAIDSIRRTYTLLNSSRLDRTIKILTLTSVFISIPTMFFSMYGMNVALPWMRHDAVFIGIMALCLFTVLTALVVMRKKHIF